MSFYQIIKASESDKGPTFKAGAWHRDKLFAFGLARKYALAEETSVVVVEYYWDKTVGEKDRILLAESLVTRILGGEAWEENLTIPSWAHSRHVLHIHWKAFEIITKEPQMFISRKREDVAQDLQNKKLEDIEARQRQLDQMLDEQDADPDAN